VARESYELEFEFMVIVAFKIKIELVLRLGSGLLRFGDDWLGFTSGLELELRIRKGADVRNVILITVYFFLCCFMFGLYLCLYCCLLCCYRLSAHEDLYRPI